MSQLKIEFVGYAYVDDTDRIETFKIEGESTEEIITRMQEAVNTWEASIRTTRGAIRPEKCNWYVLDFLWEGSK